MIESLKTGLWLTPARLKTYPILLLVMLGCGIAFLIATAQDGHDWLGRPLGSDFSDIWAAGEEVRRGQGGAGFEKMQSLFAMARLLGAYIHEAYLIQGTTAALLATLYSFDYDMVLLGPALAFARSYGREKGYDPYEKDSLRLRRGLAFAGAPIGDGGECPDRCASDELVFPCDPAPGLVRRHSFIAANRPGAQPWGALLNS